jgi:hypothetical protein
MSKAVIIWAQSGIDSATNNRQEYETTLEMPFEIGRFLIDKLTCMPGDFEACKDVIAYYQQSDLLKVLDNLDVAVKDSDTDALIMNQKELELVLDNIWSDADSIRGRWKLTKVGVPILLAVVGELASQFKGKGLLAGIGYSVVDRLINSRTEGISEKLAKWRRKNYMVGIFDFQKKYEERLHTMR